LQSAHNQNKKNLLIATSGYSYEDWKGFFYPEDIKKNQMLGFYVQHFRGVELNSPYYRIPAISVMQGLADRTPADFEFIVKVNQETTHRRIENNSAMKLLIESMRPLREQQKLKGLLAQFPYSFKNSEANRRYLSDTVDLAGESPLFFEFRHCSWLNPALHSFLESLGAGYVNVDEPALESLLPAQDVVTSDTGYIRFHGRNAEKWWDGKGMERYDYLYSENELLSWVDHIKNIMRKTVKTYIFFNNHPRGQAVNNAKQMMTILDALEESE